MAGGDQEKSSSKPLSARQASKMFDHQSVIDTAARPSPVEVAVGDDKDHQVPDD